MNMPKSITVCEVGLRDGLQNEKAVLRTEQKLALLDKIQEAGVWLIEIGSMVNPKAVPQMADTGEVYQKLEKRPDAEYRVLVLNQKGLERAVEVGMKKVKITLSVSEAHQRANANSTPLEMFEKFAPMAEYAAAHGVTLSGAMATSFGCPFEGKIPIERIKAVTAEFRKIGITELSMSDTTGMANPALVYRQCIEMQEAFPEVMWNLHFHNTRGMGLANVLAGMQAGVTRFDASLGGLGGCPFAPGATGNIATEDLLHMCGEMGIETGVDLDKMIAAAHELQDMVGHSLPGAVLKAGKVSDLYKV
ncbi:hydroxymethylglutaryl-CoA lyase [Oscillospiraceae bacterium LTW-04]|nr:hydroxymethylglutaryl-CoA lyase [Oscillospiraceae bacterium MB24-C1]